MASSPLPRSEERRVGKECRSRRSRDQAEDGIRDGRVTGVQTCALPISGAFGTTGLVMGYYDGNTVTALWNYAQHFAMNDNSYSDQYGPSTPGAINLISGQTNGFISTAQIGRASCRERV